MILKKEICQGDIDIKKNYEDFKFIEHHHMKLNNFRSLLKV